MSCVTRQSHTSVIVALQESQCLVAACLYSHIHVRTKRDQLLALKVIVVSLNMVVYLSSGAVLFFCERKGKKKELIRVTVVNTVSICIHFHSSDMKLCYVSGVNKVPAKLNVSIGRDMCMQVGRNISEKASQVQLLLSSELNFTFCLPCTLFNFQSCG